MAAAVERLAVEREGEEALAVAVEVGDLVAARVPTAIDAVEAGQRRARVVDPVDGEQDERRRDAAERATAAGWAASDRAGARPSRQRRRNSEANGHIEEQRASAPPISISPASLSE